jgi:two-component sensor histidine kinase
LNASIAFILQLQQDNLEILVVSKNSSHFRVGQKIPLSPEGSYYETTIGNNEPYYVFNAEATSILEGEDLSIKSYIGYPIRWPDGESFGALCILGIEPVEVPEVALHILKDYQRLFEQDLRALLRTRMIATVGEANTSRRKEISHRVKNHFAIISNLLQISAAKPSLGACKQVLIDTDAKIRTMAILHELLYSKESIELSVSQFLTDVLETTLGIASVETEVVTDIDKIPVIDSRNIFDLGLLISELTTNSIKNFNNHAEVLIVSLSCTVVDMSTVRITFRDNGPGFKDTFLEEPDRFGSIGYNMLRSFTRLMNGDFRQYNDNGAVIECILRM